MKVRILRTVTMVSIVAAIVATSSRTAFARSRLSSVKKFPIHRFLCYIPLFVLLYERVGSLLYYVFVDNDNLDAAVLLRSSPSSTEHPPAIGIASDNFLLTLSQLTLSNLEETCSPTFVRIDNHVSAGDASTTKFQEKSVPAAHEKRQQHQNKIPKIVHQTARSRCVTPVFGNTTQQWKFPGWSYYFHDDAAVERLLLSPSGSRLLKEQFPQLPSIAQKCLQHGTIRSDVWRYLVLWVYGGIYADLDCVPHKLNATVLTELMDPTSHSTGRNATPTDAIFVVEQFHVLSQYFMAASPRHPLLWYALQHSLTNVLLADDTGSVYTPKLTGPAALHQAFVSFRKDVGITVDPNTAGYQPVRAGYYRGSYNRSITVLGTAQDQNEYVYRDVIGSPLKKAEYRKMNMRHFQQDKLYPTQRSCLSSILNALMQNNGGSSAASIPAINRLAVENHT